MTPLGFAATPGKYGTIYMIIALVLVAIILNLILRIKIFFDRRESNAICGPSDEEDESLPINFDMIFPFGTMLILSLTVIVTLTVIAISQNDFNYLTVSRVLTVVCLGNILPLWQIAGHKPMRKFVRQILGNICPPVAGMSPSIDPRV